MPKNRAPRICLGIFFAIFVAPALAHDPSHPELNNWFNRLASGRGLCCSLTDGVTVADPDWESREGHYRVHLYGEWIDVPDDSPVLHAGQHDLEATICASHYSHPQCRSHRQPGDPE